MLTPIVFLIFNCPQTTSGVFETIREAKPIWMKELCPDLLTIKNENSAFKYL